MSKTDHLKPVRTTEEAAALGRKGGLAKKGSKHISTHIQNLLNDENFTIENWMNSGKAYKGVPLDAIITVAIFNALQGDKGWAEWLAKYGYGSQDLTVNVDNPILAIINKYGGTGKVHDIPKYVKNEEGSS